jgi:hypothetical protein
VLGYEQNRKDSKFKTTAMVLPIIPRDDNFDFHQRNRDADISLFSNPRAITFVHFSHRFGTAMTHNVIKNVESPQDYWQQEGRSRQVHEMEVRRNVNGTRNRLSIGARLSAKISLSSCKDMESLDMNEIENIYY